MARYKIIDDKGIYCTTHTVVAWLPGTCRQSRPNGLVEKSECWLYSSARNYILNADSLLSIERLKMLWTAFLECNSLFTIAREIPWQAARASLNPPRAFRVELTQIFLVDEM